MHRVRNYFEAAGGCTTENRRFGIEVETLFQDQSAPITRSHSEAMMRAITAHRGWNVETQKNGIITKVGDGRFSICYELGWNNFELITPTAPVIQSDDLLRETTLTLQDVLYEACSRSGNGKPVHLPFDWQEDADTLMMPDARDEIWRELDGQVLTVLGHIASIHFNIDLVSIEEGFELISRVERMRRDSGDWPAPDSMRIWQRYISESTAGYEPHRYGPPPADFDDYCRALGSMKVVMNRKVDELVRANPAMPFGNTPDADMDLFLRSIWWWERLRVRGGQLVLEIRDIPRGTDANIGEMWATICDGLGL